MLRKMYLVSPEYANKKPPPQPKSGSRKKRVKQKQHPHDKWVKMRYEMEEADISRKALIQKIADFLQKVLPAPVKSKIIKPDFTEHTHTQTPPLSGRRLLRYHLRHMKLYTRHQKDR